MPAMLLAGMANSDQGPLLQAALRQIRRQVQTQIGIKHAHAFLGHSRGDFAVQLHRTGIHAVAQLHGQGEHIDILWQLRQGDAVVYQAPTPAFSTNDEELELQAVLDARAASAV